MCYIFYSGTNSINVAKSQTRDGKFLSHPKWDDDFHADLYAKLAARQSNGLTGKWWCPTVKTLRGWGANRPETDAFIRRRGNSALVDMSVALERIKTVAEKQGIELCKWDDVADLFNAASKIKPTKSGSPVFASKLCHFILPQAFMVFDNAALAYPISSYREYWCACRDAWKSCDKKTRDELIGVLRPKLKGKDLDYPFATKIVELCIMGRK